MNWNTDWDPYQSLMNCEHNIQQCVLAINHTTEVLKQVSNKYNHQQEVIVQLMHQNKRLNQQLNQVLNELMILKNQSPE